MTRVAILGSTGSIGTSALAVVDAHADRLQVVALAAGENAARLAEQVARYRPSLVAVATDAARREVIERLRAAGLAPDVFVGAEGRLAVATHPDADVVLCASAGTTGLEAALGALDAGKTLALANKEVLVMSGALMIDAARTHGARILPVDSEHNAIHQCLDGRDRRDVTRLILTASGGPFRLMPAADMARVTPEAALRHPTWQMGRKITIDSATLMNKGLEVIEARWLFDVPATAIDVVVHPQSVVHSMVEFLDGSVIAQMGVTDMRLPIQYAFSYPERWAGALPPLDLARIGPLEFFPPDFERFPCLTLAYQALAAGGAAPVVLNAANEVAVGLFLSGAVPFPAIASTIARALDAAPRHVSAPRTLDEVRAVDAWARAFSSATPGTLRSS